MAPEKRSATAAVPTPNKKRATVEVAPEENFAAKPAKSGPRAVLSNTLPSSLELPLSSTALVLIDFQKDFLKEGGFADALGNDVTKLWECVPGAVTLLEAARSVPLAAIVHTKEAHRADLRDLCDAKHSGQRSAPPGQRIGDVMNSEHGKLLIDGAPGNDFIDELKPACGEIILPKPGKGSFFMTGLNEKLRELGVSHLIVCGVTTEVCVQTTLREANDRGYECVLVEDATASFFPSFKAAVIEMVTSQGGIVGYTAQNSKDVADALKAAMAK